MISKKCEPDALNYRLVPDISMLILMQMIRIQYSSIRYSRIVKSIRIKFRRVQSKVLI